MFCYFDPNLKKFEFEIDDYKYIENEKYIFLFDGELLGELCSIDLLDVVEVFNLHHMFSGPFLLLVYKKETYELRIYQHFLGNGENLYFSKLGDAVAISSRLRLLKNKTKMKFKLNTPMLPHFFYNGFLPGTHTLVQGVRKLPPGYIIDINTDGIHFTKYDYLDMLSKESPACLEDKYKYALENSIKTILATQKEEIALALSGGYDSNCILYVIKKAKPEQRVNVFSVGGVNGVDETGIACEIASYYKNTKCKTSKVTPKTLEHIDEIVEILEGSVYERGIFLQYELAKLLSENQVKSFVCGECADQVFHEKTYMNIPENTFLYNYSDTPRQMASYVVLKKNRMMMTAFGINTLYPFITPEMIDIGYWTRKINGSTKEYHKGICNQMFPDKIKRLISKQGGSTDLSALFDSDVDILENIKSCKYYSEDFRITEKYPRDEALRDYYLSLLYIELFEKQFCDE